MAWSPTVEELSGLVRQSVPDDAKWREIKYQIFELPNAAGSFTERAALIEQIVATHNWPQLVAVKQTKITVPDNIITIDKALPDVVKGKISPSPTPVVTVTV